MRNNNKYGPSLDAERRLNDWYWDRLLDLAFYPGPFFKKVKKVSQKQRKDLTFDLDYGIIGVE